MIITNENENCIWSENSKRENIHLTKCLWHHHLSWCWWWHEVRQKGKCDAGKWKGMGDAGKMLPIKEEQIKFSHTFRPASGTERFSKYISPSFAHAEKTSRENKSITFSGKLTFPFPLILLSTGIFPFLLLRLTAISRNRHSQSRHTHIVTLKSVCRENG